MKVLNVEPEGYSREAYSILGEIGEVVEKECDRNMLLSLISAFDVLIVRLGHKIDAEVFDAGENLKVVVTATTGLNHIALEEAKKRGVVVLSLKGEKSFLNSITATAEHTWGLLLSLVRMIPSAVEHVRDGNWDRDQFKGRQLSGLTLGIIGLGRLGTIIAEYGRAFRMRVVANDREDVARTENIEMICLAELLASSDVVCLLPSYDAVSHELIGSREFKMMKSNALLVNSSRGEVVDEAALLFALQNGEIAGAALDVLANETDQNKSWSARHPLIEYSQASRNLIITPHIGGATLDSMRQTEIFMAQKLTKFVRGFV